MPDLEFNIRFKVRTSYVSVQDRIGAKHRLWDFLNDIKKNLVEWTDTDAELAEQLITSSLGILYPHFTAIDIEKELRNIYQTINRDIPSGFIPLYTSCFERYVTARLGKIK